MIELPEASCLSVQLDKQLKGKIIKKVITNQSRHKFAFFTGDPAWYHDYLVGKTIDGAEAIAGLVEIKIENQRLLLGDGIHIRYFDEDNKSIRKCQLKILFEDQSLIVCSVQMYGGMWVYKEGENDSFYYSVAKEKPSPLSEAFDYAYFMKVFKNCKPNTSAKAFLATKQHIPGLGNGVLQDILFCSDIHPKRKIESLSEQETLFLFKQVKMVLTEMTTKGGRDTERDLYGKEGGYYTLLSSKTAKQPCPRCADSIIRQAYLGGSIYFCPSCQPLK